MAANINKRWSFVKFWSFLKALSSLLFIHIQWNGLLRAKGLLSLTRGTLKTKKGNLAYPPTRKEAGHKLKRKKMIIALHINLLYWQKAQTENYRRSFSYSSAFLWNKLSRNLLTALNLYIYIMKYLYGFLTNYVGFWHISNFYAHW